MALHYLGLRLGMNPKLHWLQVVARDKALLRSHIPESRRENKDSLVPTTQNSLQPHGGPAHRRWPLAGLQIMPQVPSHRKALPFAAGTLSTSPDPPHTCPLNMTVAQLSLPFFKTKTMFPGMTWSSSGVSGTKPNNTRWASPSRALRGTRKTQPIVQLGPHPLTAGEALEARDLAQYSL